VWLLAILPLPLVFLPYGFAWAAVVLAGLDAYQLVKKDGYVDAEQLLTKKGYKAISLRLWAFFLYPVYMFKRTRLLDKKQTPFIVWCAAFVLAIALAVFAFNDDDHYASLGGGLQSYPSTALGQANDARLKGADESAPSEPSLPTTSVGEVLNEYRANANKAQAKFGGKRFRFIGKVIHQESRPSGNIKVNVADLSEIPASELALGVFVATFDASQGKTLADGKAQAERQDREFKITFDGTVGKATISDEEDYEGFPTVEIADCKIVSVHTSNAAYEAPKAKEPGLDSYQAYIDSGMEHGLNGNYDQAINDFTSAIKLDSSKYRVYVLRGMLYREKGLFDQAIADFSKAIQLNPLFAPAYDQRGLAYFQKLRDSKLDKETGVGLLLSMFSDLSKATELDPNNADYIAHYGMVSLAAGNKAEALKYCNRALSIDPQNKVALSLRADLYK